LLVHFISHIYFFNIDFFYHVLVYSAFYAIYIYTLLAPLKKYHSYKKKTISCINTDNIDTNNKDFSEVYLCLVKLENSVESNPDVIEIINTLEQECQRQDDSRFIIFVKRRVTAKALAERLPQYLKSLYLTGQRSKDTCGIYIRSYKLV
jgi:ERCC4-related helicase